MRPRGMGRHLLDILALSTCGKRARGGNRRILESSLATRTRILGPVLEFVLLYSPPCSQVFNAFLVIFNGFEVGFRSNGIWGSLPAKSWDFTIAPWVLLGLCAILILARWGYQGWDWQQEALADVNLHRGKSQPVEKREKSKNLLMRGWIWILNKI